MGKNTHLTAQDYYHAGNMAIVRNDYTLAKEYLTKAITMNPAISWYYFAMYRLYDILEDHDKSNSYYKQWQQLDDKNTRHEFHKPKEEKKEVAVSLDGYVTCNYLASKYKVTQEMIRHIARRNKKIRFLVVAKALTHFYIHEQDFSDFSNADVLFKDLIKGIPEDYISNANAVKKYNINYGVIPVAVERGYLKCLRGRRQSLWVKETDLIEYLRATNRLD